MGPLRSHIARFALLAGMLAWLTGLGAQQIHRIAVLHVVCADHGVILEVSGAEGPELTAQTPSVGEAPTLEHDHDCALQGITTAAVAPPAHATPPPRPEHVKELRHRLAQAPRAPPLSYAPKTSPPC